MNKKKIKFVLEYECDFENCKYKGSPNFERCSSCTYSKLISQKSLREIINNS